MYPHEKCKGTKLSCGKGLPSGRGIILRINFSNDGLVGVWSNKQIHGDITAPATHALKEKQRKENYKYF